MTVVENGVPKLVVADKLEVTDSNVALFNHLVAEGVEAWVKAGKLLVQMVEANPNAYSIIMRDNPHITPDILITFERIGRREVYPFLLLQKSPATAKLLTYQFDFQEKYYKTPVEVIVGVQRGKPIIEKKLAMHMTKDEAKLAFGPHGYRPIKEQQELYVPPAKMRASHNESSPRTNQSLVSVGCFRFVPDKKGQPTLSKMDREELVAPIRLEIVRDNNGGFGSEPFEVFREETEEERSVRLDGADKKPRGLGSAITEEIERMESEIEELESKRDEEISISGKAKLQKQIDSLTRKIESRRLIA